MAELIIQYKNKNNDKLYPVTLTTAVIDAEGETVETRLSKHSNDIVSVSQEVKSLSDKVDNLNKDEISWIEVQ